MERTVTERRTNIRFGQALESISKSKNPKNRIIYFRAEIETSVFRKELTKEDAERLYARLNELEKTLDKPG